MHTKHVILMLACCLIPIAGVVVVSTLAIPIASVVQSALVLMCPIMMLVMLLTMRDHGHERHHEHASAPTDKNE